MSIQSGSQRAGPGGAITLVATLISIYIVSQFLRNSIGVIAPNLADELGLSPAEIGLLVERILFRLCGGPNSARDGARPLRPAACLVVGAAITVVGAVVFAAAASPAMLILGRALLGLGTAGSLVASLAVYAHRFPPDRFATLTGLQIGFGTVGTLIATAPLAFSTATIGWRGSFLAVGAFTGLVGLLIAVVVRDDAPRARPARDVARELVGHPFRAAHAVGRASVRHEPGDLFHLRSHRGLWGGPYLTHVYGYSLEAARKLPARSRCSHRSSDR